MTRMDLKVIDCVMKTARMVKVLATDSNEGSSCCYHSIASVVLVAAVTCSS